MPVEVPVATEVICERCGATLSEGTYWCPACGKLNASLRLRVVFVVFVISLFAGTALTKWYVSYLRDLESSLAQRWFTRGDKAMGNHDPAAAIEDYRNALGYDGGNQAYRRKLAEALMADQRLAEARGYLSALWVRDPANAELNLDLARLYARENKPALAIRYYRTAVDGVWDEDPIQRRIDTRFELVHYLMQQGDKARAVAELIALQAEAPQDLTVQLSVGDLLLQLGENNRASKTFDAILRVQPENVSAMTGGGQAALASGDYRKAVRLLSAAQSRAKEAGKETNQLSDELELARAALNGDPSLRNLTLEQRATRVAAAFDLAMDRLKRCAEEQNIALGPETPGTADQKHAPPLPNKQNGYVTPIAPPAAPPSPLQLLYASGIQRKKAATPAALRKDPDAMVPTMDFVFDTVHATEKFCPLQTPEEKALDLISRREAEEQR